jgi:hypothetical protein
MTQGQSIVKGDTLQRISSAGFVLGAILIAASGLLMPHANAPTSDLQQMLKPLGEHEFLTQLSSLLIAIGFWAVMLGATGVYRSINTGGSAWAQMGFNFILIGTVLWTISLSGDVATASNVSNWLATPSDSQETMWIAIAALSVSGRGLLALTWIIYWLGIAFLGMAMIQSDVYPRWLGWAALIVSIPVTALGAIQIFVPRSITLTLIFSMLMLLTTLWNLATGIWVARRAW